MALECNALDFIQSLDDTERIQQLAVEPADGPPWLPLSACIQLARGYVYIDIPTASIMIPPMEYSQESLDVQGWCEVACKATQRSDAHWLVTISKPNAGPRSPCSFTLCFNSLTGVTLQRIRSHSRGAAKRPRSKGLVGRRGLLVLQRGSSSRVFGCPQRRSSSLYTQSGRGRLSRQLRRACATTFQCRLPRTAFPPHVR